jgi:hypothetical protein
MINSYSIALMLNIVFVWLGLCSVYYNFVCYFQNHETMKGAFVMGLFIVGIYSVWKLASKFTRLFVYGLGLIGVWFFLTQVDYGQVSKIKLKDKPQFSQLSRAGD